MGGWWGMEFGDFCRSPETGFCSNYPVSSASPSLPMDSSHQPSDREVKETREKHRTILTQTEQIETVMSFMEVEPNLPQFQQGTVPVPQEVTLLQSGTLMVLWFFVLLAQLLLFWQGKNRG